MSVKLDDITIILPTRNEEHNIGAFLNSIPASVMLVVVDASSDSTPDMITALRPERTVVIKDPGSIAEARQIGSETAYTSWLLFTDADVVFAPDYFERLSEYHDYDIIYGPKLSKDDFLGYYRWIKRGQYALHSLGIPAASGSNLIVSRRALTSLGGFDTDLTCNEDSELAWRAKRSGFTTLFASDLVVYARDHRRLRLGLLRKTFHSLSRCALLYLDLMPSRWRSRDWGYWSHYDDNNVWRDKSKNGTR